MVASLNAQVSHLVQDKLSRVKLSEVHFQ